VLYHAIDDTIVAISSPPGFASRGIVRCSGPDVVAIAEQTFIPDQPIDFATLPGFRRLTGEAVIEPECSVPAELYFFRAPKSYTRQDCIEFHTPGSPSLLAMLVQRVLELGARAALPGEFTARAFLAGAMDLTRVEAISALIYARSDAQLRVAHRMKDGRLTHLIESAQEQLAELVALVEADIDFAEEPIEFITPHDLRLRLTRLAQDLKHLIEHAESSERVDVAPTILLAGPSNVGKSTLMNRLAGHDRSICAAESGTTRDLLSAAVDLGDREATLLDAAGVDQSMSGLLQRAGDVTKDATATVDLVCVVVDVAKEHMADALAIAKHAGQTPCVVVANKTDAVSKDTVERCVARLTQAAIGPVCEISAATGDGIDECRKMLATALAMSTAPVAGDTVLVTARQRDAIVKAVAAIDRCMVEAAHIGETIDRADILALELREALEELGSVVGSVTTEDLLGRVFSSFCIGK